MRISTRAYVASVCATALVLSAGVAAWGPAAQPGTRNAVLLLAALAVIAEALTFLLPHAASGSIAYIPYLASVLIAPDWTTAAAVVAVRIGTESVQRRPVDKQLFNVAQ